MKNCDCKFNGNGGFLPDCHGHAFLPDHHHPYPNCDDDLKLTPVTCEHKPSRITLRTKIIPASLGGPDGAYAPKPGAEYNTIVVYQATGDIYEYDSNGVFTAMFPNSTLATNYYTKTEIDNMIGVAISRLEAI